MRFDVCAHSYDEHAGPQRFFAERVAQFILGSGTGVSPVSSCSVSETHRQDACPTTILELGAGTGALTRHLIGTPISRSASLNSISHKPADREIGAPILATDASPAMVQFGSVAVPQVDWAVLDAFQQFPPLASLQVSSGLLHWADDPVAMLERWKVSVPPRGRMVHAMPCEPCLTEWRALVPESPVPWRSEAEWLKIFERAGLCVTRSQSWTHAAVCDSALAMVRGLHRSGVTGRVRIGPARLRQALRAYDARHCVEGGVEATWAWLAVESTHGR